MSGPTDSKQLLEHICALANDLVTEGELAERLERAQTEQRPLRVKLGIDPTFHEVHVGHAVVIRLLELFRRHGHLPVLIIGDGTARLGDPSGRNEERPPLSAEQVEQNAETYLDQIGKILDLDACEIRRNSEWFGKMDFFDALALAARGTVARMLERDDFQKRMAANAPVHFHEPIYSLMQGWDSVMVQADIELGGNDQLFNLHMGRQLQEREGQPAQICITTPLLLGTDGRKMSKTYGNHLPLAGDPADAFGKVMSIRDEQMADWFLMLTDLPRAEVAELLGGHPRQVKGRLASEVVAWLHGPEAAQAASEAFDSQFRDGNLPEDIPSKALPPEPIRLPLLLKELGLSNSTSEARRLIQQGGVRLQGEPVTEVDHEVTPTANELLIQVGKRRAARLVASR